MSKVMDEKKLASQSAKQRKGLQKQQAQKAGSKKSGPGLMFFAIYGIACAAAGIYADRNWSSEVRMWIGHQAENLSGFGTEQSILGTMEEAGYSRVEIEQAAAWLGLLNRAKRSGELSASQLETYAAAEAVFQQGSRPNKAQIQDALKVIEELADDLS